MKKLKLYLDTSVPSAYHDENKPFRQTITQNWWNNVMKQEYEVYISQITDAEIGATKDEIKCEKFRNLIESIPVLEIPEEAKDLAQAYIDNDVIPEDYRNDALHIAVATLYNLDLLVSWNFEHLVNPETRRKVKAVNLLKGYKEIDIVSPEEVGGDKYV